jgi:hypothetical protein
MLRRGLERFGPRSQQETLMKPIRKAVIGATLAGSTLLGGALGATLLNGTANAASSTSTTAPSSSTSNPAPTGNPGGSFDPTQGDHVGADGTRETLLTGDTAEKVKAAALAAVPGGTIERVETDAEGSPYEAHMTKSDGSQVTVKVDSSFKVTSVEEGHR